MVASTTPSRVAADRAHRVRHDDAELELLKAVARQRLAAGQGVLDLGPGFGGGGPLPITSSRMGCLLDGLARGFEVLGRASGGDEVFPLSRAGSHARHRPGGRILRRLSSRLACWSPLASTGEPGCLTLVTHRTGAVRWLAGERALR